MIGRPEEQGRRPLRNHRMCLAVCSAIAFSALPAWSVARASGTVDYDTSVIYVDAVPSDNAKPIVGSGVALAPSVVVIPANRFPDAEDVTLRRGKTAGSYSARHLRVEGADVVAVQLRANSSLKMAAVPLAKTDPVETFQVTAVTADIEGFKLIHAKVDPGSKPKLHGRAPGAALFDNCGNLAGIVSDDGQVILASKLSAALAKSGIKVTTATEACAATGSGTPEAKVQQAQMEADQAKDDAKRAKNDAEKAKNEVAQVNDSKNNAEKERQRKLMIYGGGVLAIVLLGIILAAWLWTRSRRLGRELDSARAAIKKTNPAWNDCVLEGNSGTLKLSGLRLANGGLVVGRSRQDADVLLDKEDISRRHARFELLEGAVEIGDLDSTNRTFVNEMPLQKGQSRRLYDGDRVTLASNEFQFKILQKRG